MGVISDGSYDAPKGVIYSFPVTCKDGKWSIVQVQPGWAGAGREGEGERGREGGGVRERGRVCVHVRAGRAGQRAAARARSGAARAPAPPCTQPHSLSRCAALLAARPPQGLSIDAASAAKMKATGEELVEEKALALECLAE